MTAVKTQFRKFFLGACYSLSRVGLLIEFGPEGHPVVFPCRPSSQDACDDLAQSVIGLYARTDSAEFFDFDTFEIGKNGVEFHLVPERLRRSSVSISVTAAK